jgi:hypothetical protein
MKNSRAGNFHSMKRNAKKTNNLFNEIVTNLKKLYPNVTEISIIKEYGIYRAVKFKRDENSDFETKKLVI